METRSTLNRAKVMSGVNCQLGATTYEALVAVSIFSLVSLVFHQILAVSLISLHSFFEGNANRIESLEIASFLNGMLDQRAIVYSDRDPSDSGFVLGGDSLLILHDRYESYSNKFGVGSNFICVTFINEATVLTVTEVKDIGSDDMRERCSDKVIFSTKISVKLIFRTYKEEKLFEVEENRDRSAYSVIIMFTTQNDEIFSIVRLYI